MTNFKKEKGSCCYDLVDKNKSCGDAIIKIPLTADLVEQIAIGIVESGAIRYWAILDNSGKEFDEGFPDDLPESQIVASMLIDGKDIKLELTEEDEDENVEILNTAKLCEGLALAFQNGLTLPVEEPVLDNADVDSVVQYALFKDVVYG